MKVFGMAKAKKIPLLDYSFKRTENPVWVPDDKNVPVPDENLKKYCFELVIDGVLFVTNWFCKSDDDIKKQQQKIEKILDLKIKERR